MHFAKGPFARWKGGTWYNAWAYFVFDRPYVEAQRKSQGLPITLWAMQATVAPSYDSCQGTSM